MPDDLGASPLRGGAITATLDKPAAAVQAPASSAAWQRPGGTAAARQGLKIAAAATEVGLLTSFSAWAAGSSSSQRSCSPSASTCLSPWAPRCWSSRSTAPPRSPPAPAATSTWTGRCSACSPPPRWPQPRRVPGRCLPAHRRFYHPAHRRSRLLAHPQPARAGVTASYPRRGAHPDCGRVSPEDLRLYAHRRPRRWDGASFRGRRADGHAARR